MDIYEQIVQLRRDGRRGAVATIVNVRGSIPSFKTAKMLVRDDGSIVGTIGGGCVEADVWQAAREVMESEKPRTLKFDLNQDPKYDTGLVCGGPWKSLWSQFYLQHYFIFRRRPCSFNLCQTATGAGFDVVVTDDRSSYATGSASLPPAKYTRSISMRLRGSLIRMNLLTLSSSRVVIMTTCDCCAGRCRRGRDTLA